MQLIFTWETILIPQACNFLVNERREWKLQEFVKNFYVYGKVCDVALEYLNNASRFLLFFYQIEFLY